MFLDMHAHVYRYPFPYMDGRMLFCDPGQLEAFQRRFAIDRAVLLPVVSAEEYMPQSVGEILELAEASQGRWIPFCNVDPRVYTNAGDAPVGRLLEFYQKQGCRGIGEVMPNLPWTDSRFQNLLYWAQESGLPLLFDMTGRLNRGYGIYDEPGMPGLREVLEKFPRLTFIGHGPAFWAEIGPLRAPSDRWGYPAGPVEREGETVRLLREYPNLLADLSAGSGYNALHRDEPFAGAFLSEFAGKLLYGTDVCFADQDSPIGALLLRMRRAEALTDAQFSAIARKNAEKLLKLPPLPEERERGISG